MAIKIKELIKKLEKKDQNKEVEFIIISTKGEVIAIDLENTPNDMVKLLKMFK